MIAILDSGCDTDHPEYASSPRIHYGFDWYDGGSGYWPEDYCGHGTHRVGEIMAPADGVGTAGTNQNCQVSVHKVTNDDPTQAVWFAWAFAAALDYVVFEEGARVVSVSLCGASHSVPGFLLMRNALFNVNANAPGVVVLCASGNSGFGPDWWRNVIWFPAAWSCSLACVCAVGGSTPDELVWGGTEWRPGDHGGQLSFLAPGEEPHSYWTTCLGGGYDDLAGGTSGATAHAAGIAGMLISKYPWMVNHEIKTQLQNSSSMIPPPAGYAYDDTDCWGHLCWSVRMGSGRIDAVRALNLRFNRQCPSFRGRTEADEYADGPGGLRATACGVVSVYDLLGRRLYSCVISNWPQSEASAQRWLAGFKALPTGPKIVRVVTPSEIRTWRVVP